jgi:hypothetical protein
MTLLLLAVAAGLVVVAFFVHANRTVRDAQADVAERPKVVWDKDGFPWHVKANGRYRLADKNTDGCLDDWPLDALERVFGPLSTTPPEINEELND